MTEQMEVSNFTLANGFSKFQIPNSKAGMWEKDGRKWIIKISRTERGFWGFYAPLIGEYNPGLILLKSASSGFLYSPRDTAECEKLRNFSMGPNNNYKINESGLRKELYFKDNETFLSLYKWLNLAKN
ncbi:MAG: hypothetical protein K2H64_06640 [Desulfovibrio sp.]|nr:hypothetical protein [Desulfovibrio sp.]